MTRKRALVFEELGPVEVPSCKVLLTHAEVDAAQAAAQRLGLVPNPQASKSWDNLQAIRIIASLGLQPDDAIVDLGCRSGILLTWLNQLGYRNLSGCDLQEPFPPVRSALRAKLWRTVGSCLVAYARHRHRMSRAPVEETRLQSNRFSVVTSMSVIEHGIDLLRFFSESARLLVPGGVLVISTDYWPTPIDLGSLRRVAASRGPDRIFDRASVKHICELASAAGFRVPSTLDLDARESVVNFAGYRYTFILLSFRRGSESQP